MGLEAASKVAELNALWPLGTDQKAQGDDHLRMIKAIMKGMLAYDFAATEGHVRFEDVLICFGQVITNASGVATITWPEAFTSNPFVALTCVMPDQVNVANVTSFPSSGVSCQIFSQPVGAPLRAQTVHYVAIGTGA